MKEAAARKAAPRNIYLIGFMGTGKSTIARYLSQTCRLRLVEMDQAIASSAGMSIPDIFSTYGEDYFRNLETECLKSLGSSSMQVVSCGGGVVLRPENVKEMKKNGKVVLLTASPETILKRVSQDDSRPVLRGKKTLEGISSLLSARQDKYLAAADIIQPTDGKKIPEICEELLKKVREA